MPRWLGLAERQSQRLRSLSGFPREHLVLAGGGHTHALVLRKWAMQWAQQPQRRPAAWITLVNRRSTALYSGMVPGLIAGLYEREACEINLRRLADQAGVSFVEAEITGVDLKRRELLLEGRPALQFDWLSLDVGAVVAPEGEHLHGRLVEMAEPDTTCGVRVTQNTERSGTLPVKPLEPFLDWCSPLQGKDSEKSDEVITVEGSGAAAVEVALALKARGTAVELRVKPKGLALGSAKANRLLQHLLRTAAIPVQSVRSATNQPHEHSSHVTIRCTGSRAPAWLGSSGLPVDGRGRVRTLHTLQVDGQPQIFAAGDCGVIASDPRPPSGVWAVRAAPALARNLERALQGKRLKPWRPQRRALQLLGDGGVQGQPRAIALWGPLALGPSRWLWRWKDQIDQAFMHRFQALGSGMDSQGEGAAMACRGCAAKVAAQPLEEALQRLTGESSAPAAEDAAVVGRDSNGELLLQSVDGFPALVSDPWLNGRLTTLHACSDLWASGARVTSLQAVVTLPQAALALQADLLHQTLAGVRSVLDPLGAQLVGGHTLEARDAMSPGPGMPMPGLGLTLTVNGSAPASRHWPKGPLQPGLALILSRPIGTGVLFAAAMAGATKPRWLDQALAVMQQSQAPLVELLSAYGCVACTDITGFGLLGHLGEMGGSVELMADAIPALPGALQLLEAGHASTLAPSNARALALLDGPVQLVGQQAQGAALQGLLIDPQTCGPLLAAVPEAHAATALEALHGAGFHSAAVIGRTS